MGNVKPAALLFGLIALCACDARRKEQKPEPQPQRPQAEKPAPSKAPATRTLLVRLVDSGGRRTKGVVWWAKDVRAKYGTPVGTGEYADIELQDIPNEPVVLVALPPGFVVPSEGWPRHVIPAGVTLIDLVLDTGEKRTLRVLNAAPKRFNQVRLAATTDLEPSHHGIDDDGMIRLEGIRKGVRYNLYVFEYDTGRQALLRNLSAEEPWPSITLTKGHKITGRLVLPKGCEWANVAIMVDRAVMIDTAKNEHGRFEFQAIPPGTWTVVAYTTFRGKYLAVTAQTDPETPAVLDLTKAK